MKRAFRIILPIVLVLAIIVCVGWYLNVYDREFTRDMLLQSARYFESRGNHTMASQFYDWAYRQSGDNDAVAIELAEQHKAAGNYTKAEYTLTKAIADGGGVDLYAALCKTYVEQDKLLDAVYMLNNITNSAVKAQLDAMRPSAPICSPDPTTSGSYYTQLISVSVSAQEGTLYVNANGQFPSIQKDLYRQEIQLVEGENTIYAVAVADNGLVSTASVFGFTVGGIIKKIDFTDSAIETVIRQMLEINGTRDIYSNDLWDIKEFVVPTDTADLSDLQHLTFLEKVTIEDAPAGQLSNLSGLIYLKEISIMNTAVKAEELPLIGSLPKLERLTLNGCSLSTLAGLEKASNLVYLDAGNNTIRNLTPLSGLLNLQTIDLQHNALNDLSALSALGRLEYLDVSFNSLTDLSPLSSVAGLVWLDCGNNALENLNGIQALTELRHLNLSFNSLTEISSLSGCTKLNVLGISDNAITDLSPLSGMSSITHLDFSRNQVTELPALGPSSALVSINGSHNQIQTLEPLKGLSRLNFVQMDYNPDLESIAPLASCHLLIQVDVYGTKVTEVDVLTSQSVIVNYDPTQ